MLLAAIFQDGYPRGTGVRVVPWSLYPLDFWCQYPSKAQRTASAFFPSLAIVSDPFLFGFLFLEHAMHTRGTKMLPREANILWKEDPPGIQ